MEEEIFNGESKDEVHQKGVAIQDGMEGQLDDESWRMMNSVVAEESFEVAVSENGVENGKKGDGLASSSSSSDEEMEVVTAEKTDDDTGAISTVNYEDEEKGDLDLIVEEEQAAEIDSIQLIELKNVEELVQETVEDEETVDEADISTEHEENGLAEEEREVTITEESLSPISEAAAVELVDVVDENGVQEQDRIKDAEEVWSTVVGEIEAQSADQVAKVEEVLLSTTAKTREAEFIVKEDIIGILQNGNEEDSALDVAKSSNGTDESNKTELPESNGNPHIISISTRTVQPTSWKGCCGLLEVFRRGDR